MPTSLLDENHEIDIAIFDSFSRSVLQNSINQIKRERRSTQDHETVNEDIVQRITENVGKEDLYPSEFVISVEHGYSCVVTLEWLYQAMLLLPKNQKEVLILEFWHGLSRGEVAAILNVSEKTISIWKRKAFNSIRDYYEREKINGS